VIGKEKGELPQGKTGKRKVFSKTISNVRDRPGGWFHEMTSNVCELGGKKNSIVAREKGEMGLVEVGAWGGVLRQYRK